MLAGWHCWRARRRSAADKPRSSNRAQGRRSCCTPAQEDAQGEELRRRRSPRSRKPRRSRTRPPTISTSSPNSPGVAYVDAQNYAEAAKTCEDQLNDGFTTEARTRRRCASLAADQLPAQELRQGDRVRQPRREGRRGDEDDKHDPRPVVLPQGRLEGHARSSRTRSSTRRSRPGRRRRSSSCG